MKLSHRVETLPISPTRRYITLANEVEEKGTKVLRLSVGQPDLPAPNEYFAALQNVKPGVMGYAFAMGISEMRKAQKEYYARYHVHYEEDEIFVTTGATEGIQFALQSLCDVGDAVMLIEPYYTNYGMLTHILGVEVRSVTTRVEDNYSVPDRSAFEAAYSENVKAILLSNPGNPTGRVYTREELQTIVDFALVHDLVVISDEVYREFNFKEESFISLYEFEALRPNLVLLDSASKKYAVCGARVGTASTKNELLKTGFTRLSQMRLAVSKTEQAAVASLATMDPSYHEQVREIYRSRRECLLHELSKIEGISYSNPEGAFYVLVKFPVKNAEDFVVWLLTQFAVDGETTLLTPAADFYYTKGAGEDEVRLSYCVDEEVLRRALRIIREGLIAYQKKED